jgi:hypothetical protein
VALGLGAFDQALHQAEPRAEPLLGAAVEQGFQRSPYSPAEPELQAARIGIAVQRRENCV